MGNKYFVDKILRQIRLKQVKKYIKNNSLVCDIGCGADAFLLKSLLPKIKKGWGFDPKLNTRLSEKEKSKINLIKKRLKRLPLKSNSIDTVIITAVIEHLEDPQLILSECFRVLQKGGRLLLTTPTPSAKPILEFIAHKIKLIDPQEIKEHKRYFDKKMLRKILSQIGYKKIQIKPYNLGLNIFVVCFK